MEGYPQPGERCRDEKRGLCQVIGVAVHHRTGETLVVYQKLYEDFGLYVCPVDEWAVRFQRIAAKKEGEPQEGQEECHGEPNPILVRFLEAEQLSDRLNLLDALEQTAVLADVKGLEAALDTDLGQGSIGERIENAKKLLRIRARYDGSHLRDGKRERWNE